jgi:hypothetical protein
MADPPGLGFDTDFTPALPTALMKPLSGSGSKAMMIDAMKTYGVDSFVGRLACIFQGSADTTFYIVALYFGSVGIRKTRYAISCGLIADLAGISPPSPWPMCSSAGITAQVQVHAQVQAQLPQTCRSRSAACCKRQNTARGGRHRRHARRHHADLAQRHAKHAAGIDHEAVHHADGA